MIINLYLFVKYFSRKIPWENQGGMGTINLLTYKGLLTIICIVENGNLPRTTYGAPRKDDST